MTKASVESVDTKGSGCKVLVKTKKGEETIECDVVLSAVGIQANIENIGLEEVGIKIDNGKIIVDDFYRTNIPGVYAIGDGLPTQALAHEASAEGIICVERIAGHDPEPIDYIIPGNDDAIRSINLYANYFKATLSDARELSKNIKKEKMNEEKEKKEK